MSNIDVARIILGEFQINKNTLFSQDFTNRFVPLFSYLSENDEEIAKMYLGGESLSSLVSDFTDGVYLKHLSAMGKKKYFDNYGIRSSIDHILLGLVKGRVETLEEELKGIKIACTELELMTPGDDFQAAKINLKNKLKSIVSRYFRSQDECSDDGLTLKISEYNQNILESVARVLILESN